MLSRVFPLTRWFPNCDSAAINYSACKPSRFENPALHSAPFGPVPRAPLAFSAQIATDAKKAAKKA